MSYILVPPKLSFTIDGENISEYLASIGTSCNAEDNIPDSEMLALQSLYNATNGPYWTGWDRPGKYRQKERWNFTGFDGAGDQDFPNPCNSSWQGVSCIRNFTRDNVRLNCSVVALDLAYMNLTGKLPSMLSSLSQLEILELNFNHLTGTVPSDLYATTSLVYVNVYHNHLTGTISTELGKMTDLMFIGFMENSFSGTIPTEIGYLLDLREIYIYANYFSGPIPSVLSNFCNLSTLDLYYNQFTGTIPLELAELTLLFNFEVTRNLLSGPVPRFFGDELLLLKYLELAENYFTGSLSPQLGNLTQLAELGLDQNYLTGTLFPDFTNLTKLETLSLSNNYFSKSLPASIANLPVLANMLLSGNMFTGDINSLFPVGCLHDLGVVDISNNGFTGFIPAGLLSGENRVSVAMVKNCFRGSLSESVCLNASSLTDIALDGLSAGDFCRRYTFPHVLSSYTSNLMTGTIPGCLYKLPSIETLQLSGNGFTGSLPNCASSTNVDNADKACANPLGKNLSTLILSHNRIVGTIPHAFQSFHFNELDLSYNRLTGTATNMSGFFTGSQYTNPQLALQVNRLSGNIPSSFQQVYNISMLDGNLFGCKSLEDLPIHDPQYESAQCGSTQLYQIITVYCCCLLVIFAVLFYVYRFIQVAGISVSGHYSKSATNLQVLLSEKPVADPKVVAPQMSSETGFMQSSINSDFSDRLESVSERSDVLRTQNIGEVQRNQHSMMTYINQIQGSLSSWKSLVLFSFSVTNRFTAETSSLVAINRKYVIFLRWIRWFCAYTVVIILTVFLSTFLALKFVSSDVYSTHTYDYGWLPSIAFLLGLTPGIVLAVEVMVGVLVLQFALSGISEQLRLYSDRKTSENHTLSVTNNMLSKTARSSSFTVDRGKLRTKFREILIIMVDVIIMITANSLFLFASFNLGRDQLVFVQVCLVFFKLSFNRSVLPWLLTWVYSNISGRGWLNHSDNENLFKSTNGLSLQTGLIIFNNILAPCIAIFATDSTCFHNLLINSNPISSSFGYNVCVYVNGITETCDIYEVITVTTSFNAPFIYSYQCSSALLTTYVPVFLIMYGYTGFVSPLVDCIRIRCCESIGLDRYPWLKYIALQSTPLLMRPIQYSLRYVDDVVCTEEMVPTSSSKQVDQHTEGSSFRMSSATDNSKIVSDSFMKPSDLRELYENEYNDVRNSISDKSVRDSVILKVREKHFSVESNFSNLSEHPSALSFSSVSKKPLPRLFNAGNFTSGMICNMIILLTYGVGYPPLAFVVALSTIIESFHMQYLLGRYWKQILDLESSTNDREKDGVTLMTADRRVPAGTDSCNMAKLCTGTQRILIYILESTFLEATSAVAQMTAVILFVVSLFFSFFIYDMIGDSCDRDSAFHRYYAFVIVVALFPVVVTGAGYFLSSSKQRGWGWGWGWMDNKNTTVNPKQSAIDTKETTIPGIGESSAFGRSECEDSKHDGIGLQVISPLSGTVSDITEC